MKTRTTLFLLALAGLLLGFIQLYEMNQPTTREADVRERYLMVFDRNRVEGILLKNSQETVELRKNNGVWEIKSPIEDQANQEAVQELLSLCESLQKDAKLLGKAKDKKPSKEFGLRKAHLRLKLLGTEMPAELLFGKDTAVEGKTYVGFEGSSTAYVAGSELKSRISRKADEWREPRLSRMETAPFQRISFKTGSGEIELEKKFGHWYINKPLRTRADDGVIGEMLAGLFNTQIVAFVPEKGVNLNSYGLAEPSGTVSFWAEGVDKPVTLEIGSLDEKAESVYARVSTRSSVVLLPKQIGRLATVKPSDLRDRHLLRLDLDTVDRVSIQTDGKTKLLLQRRLEDWLVAEVPSLEAPAKPVFFAANAAKIQSMMNLLQTREVAGLVTDVATDVERYGLDKPELALTFSSYASENTAESGAGERPLATVNFGASLGNHVYAQVRNEPFVVAVDQDVVRQIDTELHAWRSLSVFAYKPEDIVSLDISYDPASGLPPISLVHNGGVWKVAGENVQTQALPLNIQSLVNTLSKLSAVRWLGSYDQLSGEGPQGAVASLRNPSMSITFRLRDGTEKKLMLGVLSTENLCPARVAGDHGVFVISAPDESAFRLKLQEPLPAAAE